MLPRGMKAIETVLQIRKPEIMLWTMSAKNLLPSLYLLAVTEEFGFLSDYIINKNVIGGIGLSIEDLEQSLL